MSWIDEATAFADQRVHKHNRAYVFPDGVVLGDALDAIAAAGLAANYALANQLSVTYALDVCVRCARRFIDLAIDKATEKDPDARTPLSDLGIMTSWGSVCSLCKLTLLAHGETRRIR